MIQQDLIPTLIKYQCWGSHDLKLLCHTILKFELDYCVLDMKILHGQNRLHIAAMNLNVLEIVSDRNKESIPHATLCHSQNSFYLISFIFDFQSHIKHVMH